MNNYAENNKLKNNNAEEDLGKETINIEHNDISSKVNLVQFDFSDIEFSKTKSSSRGVSGAPGYLTVINSKKNGKRVTVAGKVMEHLNFPDKLEFSYYKNEKILISQEFSATADVAQHAVRREKEGKKGIIYSYDLVEEITNRFNLDFSGKTTSITFRKLEFAENNGKLVAIISLG
ncbi:hypothetical protein C1H57_08165 [Clostridium sp. 2-1]|uniref:hypothetical protein n=1 Tax=Clostridium TaxID=1485 RepID=UPI00040F9368|nr:MULTISPECIES: hypothetical protein [Clostridium]MBN7575381.1 hypothetical protein [Clostridium beijerinckii]MBN7580692.1 hypothetical protein [Clostridium beijerinckii]MBN7585145.1 hypothetical protein [Clostridium beijerinckii]MBO0522525.1 hypothetical protein [Clostridium beijerinckii]POO91787.1 hypothetical protein C1H57_08165 [Clostridium sp. 2-1]